MTRVVASIEARMQSSRLPEKVLLDVCGQPSLTRLLRRLRQSKLIDDIVLATSTEPQDHVLADWAASEQVACFRGSEDDVLSRVVDAQLSMDADIIVEVCGDTPLIDAEVVDHAIETFLANECDVVSNTYKPSYPQGIDAQVFYFKDLAFVAETVWDAAVREHVSLYFYEHPEQYRIIHLIAPPTLKRPNLRLQMDYEEDYRLINEIYRRLEPEHGDGFRTDSILTLLDANPDLRNINRHRAEKPVR